MDENLSRNHFHFHIQYHFLRFRYLVQQKAKLII